MEYPLVPSRKHVGSGLPVEEYHIRVPDDTVGESKNDIEDTTAPPPPPVQPKSSGGFWNRTLTACSCFNIPDEPATIKIRRCCDCGRKINTGEEFLRETVVLSTTKTTIQSDTERQAYCLECSQINQGRLDHAICIKGVRRDLRTHFKLKRKQKREEVEIAKQMVGIEEKERKNKFRIWLKTRKSKKQKETERLNETQDSSLNETQDSTLNETQDSSLSDSQHSSLNEEQESPLNETGISSINPVEEEDDAPLDDTQDPTEEEDAPLDDAEDPIEEKQDAPLDETQDPVEEEKDSPQNTPEEKREELQMVYSAPKSLHYRFEEVGVENENKTHYVPKTKKKKKGLARLAKRVKRSFSKREKEYGTKVKTVAISW